MSENIARPPASQTISRPIGVWVLTIYALLFAGIAPLLLSVFILISGNAPGNEIGILLSLPVSIGVITSAVGAWRGSERARKSLLIFVTLHYFLVALNNYLVITSGQVPDEEGTLLWGRVFRGFTFPVIYLWYFNRDTTKEFYN